MTLVRRPKAFGTGLIALDVLVGPDPEIPVRCWAGGTCGNVLSILAYLGWDAYPIARMNGDVASERVLSDMGQWGVYLDWVDCAPTANTPIVVQNLKRRRDGLPEHRFSWFCPKCGEWLPSFRAITIDAVEKIKPDLVDASVFFLDRLSRANLTLAAEASANGAVVVFEPSSKSSDKMMGEAIALAHVIKYAEDRLTGIDGISADHSAVLLEVQTLGEQGLRYRHRLGGGLSEWMYLEALHTPRFTDSCGSGDWCTAGLIAKTTANGQRGLWRAGVSGVRTALLYGQALAAWNCSFEGARGGMYTVTKPEFESQVMSLSRGEVDSMKDSPVRDKWMEFEACPSCPSPSGAIG